MGSVSIARTSIVYIPFFLQNVLKIDPMTNALLGIIGVVATPFGPIFGACFDEKGRAKTMLVGTVLWMLAA